MHVYNIFVVTYFTYTDFTFWCPRCAKHSNLYMYSSPSISYNSIVGEYMCALFLALKFFALMLMLFHCHFQLHVKSYSYVCLIYFTPTLFVDAKQNKNGDKDARTNLKLKTIKLYPFTKL